MDSTIVPLLNMYFRVLDGLKGFQWQVLGWAQAMPMYAGEILELVQTLLERTLERCRAGYTEVNIRIANLLAETFFHESLLKVMCLLMKT